MSILKHNKVWKMVKLELDDYKPANPHHSLGIKKAIRRCCKRAENLDAMKIEMENPE